MNTRPTPETDAFWEEGHLQRPTLTEAKEFARKLERERDEALDLITKTKSMLQQVDLPDEPLDVQAQRMVAQHDWQLGIARGQAKQIEQANRTVLAMREAITEAWIEINYAESGFAGLALRVCPNDSAVDLVLSRMTEALAKLQPFIEP